jgi:superfamily I DNA/RNA helicase
VLRLNYRSTAQIVRWAMSVMVAGQVDEFEDGNTDRRGYRSVLRGESPTVTRYERSKDEIEGLINSVRALIGETARPDEILVAARTNETVNRIHARLEDSGISSVVLGKNAAYNPDKVHVSTFHRLKGLEYKHVLLVDLSKGSLPSASAVTSAAIDPQRHLDDIASERSLLFVAATRARDSLHTALV